MAGGTHPARTALALVTRRLGGVVRRAFSVASRLDVVRVDGESMSPRIRHGDWLVVLRGARVRQGDVVLVRRPDLPEVVAVKRAVDRLTRGWWVAGDNPSQSTDSRAFGAVPEEYVLGRVLFRYWPPVRSRSR